MKTRNPKTKKPFVMPPGVTTLDVGLVGPDADLMMDFISDAAWAAFYFGNLVRDTYRAGRPPTRADIAAVFEARRKVAARPKSDHREQREARALREAAGVTGPLAPHCEAAGVTGPLAPHCEAAGRAAAAIIAKHEDVS
jgi:hypothetical protein